MLGQVNQVVIVLNDTHAVMLCTCRLPNSGGITSPILKKISKLINVNNPSLNSTISQELHSSFTMFFFSLTYNIFKFFITSEPCSILPSSHFSSHHPLPHLQCHLCQLWLAFFGFSKKISPGIVLHSLFDRKDVPELTHKVFFLR